MFISLNLEHNFMESNLFTKVNPTKVHIEWQTYFYFDRLIKLQIIKVIDRITAFNIILIVVLKFIRFNFCFYYF